MRNRYLSLLLLMFLAACHPPARPIADSGPLSQKQSSQKHIVTYGEFFSEQCGAEGIAVGSKEHRQCIEDKRKEWAGVEQAAGHKNRVVEEKQQQIALAQAEKENHEREAKIRQEKLNADKAICDKYGIKRGTTAFSGCLIQIEQARQQQAQQERVLEAQRQMQQEALEAQTRAQQAAQRSAAWQSLQNFGEALMQNSQQQNYQNQQLLLNSMPKTTNCRRTWQGMDCTTW